MTAVPVHCLDENTASTLLLPRVNMKPFEYLFPPSFTLEYLSQWWSEQLRNVSKRNLLWLDRLQYFSNVSPTHPHNTLVCARVHTIKKRSFFPPLLLITAQTKIPGSISVVRHQFLECSLISESQLYTQEAYNLSVIAFSNLSYFLMAAL